MRVTFFVLLGLNLVYLAWAGWVAAPDPEPLVAEVNRKLPQLTLASEEQPTDSTALSRPVTSRAPLPAPVSPPEGTPVASTESSSRCVSVGPFNDLAHAARGAALLRERGFDPEQRAEQGETWEGFWVYVGNLASAADETRVVQALARAGLRDARPMPATGEGRRVSVGLFTERARAERRAQTVKRLGFAAEIVERRQPGTVYWVDIELEDDSRTVPMEGLLSLENAGARLEIRVCPEAAAAPSVTPARPAPLPRDARPAATTAAADALPG